MNKYFYIAGGLALMGYLVWLLTPPTDPIGSIIPQFDTADRRRRMIIDEEQQDIDMGFI